MYVDKKPKVYELFDWEDVPIYLKVYTYINASECKIEFSYVYSSYLTHQWGTCIGDSHM